LSDAFAVRTLQPVLENLEREVEEAAATLGASRVRTFFSIIARRCCHDHYRIRPGLCARGANTGSIVFISGNQPFKTEIARI